MAPAKYIPGTLRRHDPEGAPCPVVFDVPRSGCDYPQRFRSPASFDDVHRSVSMYLEELYAGVTDAGANLLFACFPNAFIDANRQETDIDPDLIDGEWPDPLDPTIKSKLGIGLIHSVCGTGNVPLHDGKLTVEDIRDRLESYYWPYHNELSRLLADHRARHGVAYHVSCHSMAAIGGQATVDAGKPRKQVDIGDLNGQSCEPGFVEVVKRKMEELGYEVAVNFHYAGAEAIRKHCDPAGGIHSLQIELNRGLYMDEETFTRNAGFDRLQRDLTTLAGAIAEYARDRAAQSKAETK